MGVPLSHVPDPAGDCHPSYARHFAQVFIDTFDGLGIRPDTYYWMSEIYGSGAMDRYIRTALDAAATVREIYVRVAKRSPSRRLASALRHLRQLRAHRHDHRDRLGRRAGPLRVPPGPRHVGDRLRPQRRRLAVRRPRQAAVQRRLGREVGPVRRDDRARRQGPVDGRRLPRPIRRHRARGVRQRAAAQRAVRVPQHPRPEDVDVEGAGGIGHPDRRRHPARAAAPPLPAPAAEHRDRVRPRGDRCHPAPLRRVGPPGRRHRRPRGAR